MATNRRSTRRSRTTQRPSHLGFEGLEPRTVLSGMPIDLQAFAGAALARLSGGRLPPLEGGGPIADVEPAGFAVTLPSVVPNGLPVRALVMAVGADGRPVSFSGEVTVSSSDAAATFPETVTLTRGRALVSVTFATAGEQTLDITSGGETPITGSDTTRVAEPIVATELAILMPDTAKVGGPVRVMVMALDANGRAVPTFDGELTLASSDEAVTLPETVAFERGRARFTVTFATEGEQTLTAKAGDLTAEAATTVSAQPAVADLRVELRAEVVAGSMTRVMAVALDAEGEVISDFSGSAAVTSSDEGATLPEIVQFRRGRARFEVAFAALGEQQLTVTSGEVSGTASTVVTEAPAIASIGIWMPGKVLAGLPMVVQVMALDAEGRPVRSFEGSFEVKSSDAEARLPSSVTFIRGIALLKVAFATVGEQTLTVSDPANPDLTSTATTTVREFKFPSLPPWRRR